MAIEISITNSSFKDESKVLNNMKAATDEDVKIRLEDITLERNVQMLNDLEIGVLMQNEDISREEYFALQKIMKVKEEKSKYRNMILEHISTFSQGVLASVVANMLTR